mgnify:CR=1 FL=1
MQQQQSKKLKKVNKGCGLCCKIYWEAEKSKFPTYLSIDEINYAKTEGTNATIPRRNFVAEYQQGDTNEDQNLQS